MRILVDQKDLITGAPNPRIPQVDKTPASVDGTAINGRFVVPIVEGVEFQVDSTSYVLPVDGQDVSSQSFAYLLAAFPMCGHIFFNPLLTALDIEAASGGIDFPKTFKDTTNPPPAPPTTTSGSSSTRPAGWRLPSITAGTGRWT